VVGMELVLSQNLALLLTQRILSVSLFLFGLEFYFLGRSKSFLKVWTYSNFKSEISAGLPLPNFILKNLFSENSLKYLALIQIVMSVFSFFYFSGLILTCLFLLHLASTIRFRGTFNGGSDMMVFVVLTGLLITAATPIDYQKFGLIYITIHSIFSYFKSGYSKLMQSEWRNGWALSVFLERSQFSIARQLSQWLKPNRNLSKLLCWSVLFFELSFVVLPFIPSSVHYYLVVALLFHFVIYLLFGLNRFFWAWFSSWPAILYVIGNRPY
jgi:hypothetical protein